MILLLNTSTEVTFLVIVDSTGKRYDFEWASGRELSKGLLAFMRDSLLALNSDFTGLAGLGVYRGPGSYTGLRIGITVLNTLADSLSIPIVGSISEDWEDDLTDRLKNGENEKIILPLYGGDANITKPRK